MPGWSWDLWIKTIWISEKSWFKITLRVHSTTSHIRLIVFQLPMFPSRVKNTRFKKQNNFFFKQFFWLYSAADTHHSCSHLRSPSSRPLHRRSSWSSTELAGTLHTYNSSRQIRPNSRPGCYTWTRYWHTRHCHTWWSCFPDILSNMMMV